MTENYTPEDLKMEDGFITRADVEREAFELIESKYGYEGRNN